MIHAVTFMAKGDIPMEKILPMMRFFIFQKPGMKWTKLSLLRKWFTTHIIPINCDRTVAIAAPRIPQPKWKMKTGAMMTLAITVTRDVNMAFFGYPVARITLFNPIMV